MKQRHWLMAVAALCTGIYTVNAQEQPSPQELAVAATETRQAVFKLLRFNLGTISGMARGEVEFDAAIAERNARRIGTLATMIPEVLGAMDTRPYDVETEALPIIWDRFEEVREKAANLENAAATFAEVASRGDRMETIGALRPFGAACGNCHDTFRLDTD